MLKIIKKIIIGGSSTDNPHYISKLIRKKAEEHKINVKYLAALIYQESGGDPFATRYEPGFYRRYLEKKERKDLNGYVPLNIPTLATEKRFRATSWGLCQVMGETARGHGYKPRYLSRLTQPEENIEVGCQVLGKLLARYAIKGNEKEQYRAAFMAYNGGIRENYSKQVEDYALKLFGHVESEDYKLILF